MKTNKTKSTQTNNKTMLTALTSTPYSDPRPRATERQRTHAAAVMRGVLARAEDVPLSKLWRIEWNPRRKSLHVGEAAPAARYLQNRWTPEGLGGETIGYAGTEEDANRFADAWELYTLGVS